MKIVKQYNDYACVLACLESYLADHGHVVTQAELLARYPQHCNVGRNIEGAFSLSRDSLAQIGGDFGFTGDLTLAFAPANKRDYFIVTTEGDKHCVRVHRYLGGTRFEVMDPNINRGNNREEYAVFDFAVEAARQPAFLELNRSA
jgi:ABC-type bacteriocin/lantibiotic exporter with double-glycine peptidase domain